MFKISYLGLSVLFSSLTFAQSASIYLPITTTFEYKCFSQIEIPNRPHDYIRYASNHYYFQEGDSPRIIPVGFENTVCHDIDLYGDDDSLNFSRLEEKVAFQMWDDKSSFMDDEDLDGVLDINEMITKEYRRLTHDQGDSSIRIDLFSLFEWSKEPVLQEGDSTLAKLGVVMIPFLNESGYSHCPDQYDYNGNEPLYNIVGDFVGLDTQGLYMAEGEPQITPGSYDISYDVILISERDLKKVWFYFEDGQFLTPDRDTAQTKTIHFFYPLDFENPYIQKPYQKLFTIRVPSEIGIDGVNTGVFASPAPDKRFACIIK